METQYHARAPPGQKDPSEETKEETPRQAGKSRGSRAVADTGEEPAPNAASSGFKTEDEKRSLIRPV